MATKLGTLTLDLVARIGSFTQGMNQASTTAEREMRRVENSVVTVDSLIKKLAVTAGAAFSVSQVSNYADIYTGVVNKLKLVTDSQGQLSTAMADTHKIAQATASDWESVVTVYTKFQKISEGLGLTQIEVARITETVTKAIGMSGATADEGQRALTQFGQALNTGALKGQDLNSILSQTPGLTDAIAEGMGIASKDLKQLGADGKLTNEVIIQSLTKVASSVDAKYSETATLISASFSLVKNEAIKMVGEFDASTGASKKFVESMTLLSQNLGTITKLMMVGGAYMAGTYIPILATTAIGFARNTAEVIRYQLALAGMQASATGASRSLIILKGVLGGPVGMGLTLAAVAAGYLLMKDGADKATASIDYQGQRLDDLIVKYQELNTLQRDNETKALADQVQDLSLKFRVASSDLTGFMQALPVSDEKINTWSKLHSQFSLGKISSDEYYKSIKVLNFLSDDQLNKVRGLIGGYESSNTKMKQAEAAQKALAMAAGQTTAEVKKQAAETAKLTEELEKLLKKSSESIKDSAITSALANRGYNDTMIALAKQYLSVEGAIVTNAKGQRVLRDDLKKMLKAEYDAIMASKNAVDSRNKSEEKTKKLIEAQGSAMKVNAKVAANAAKYNFAGIESKNNLPSGLLAAIHMQESRGNANAYNKGSGAAGGFQFLKATGDQYGVKNRNDLAQSAEGAGKYMSYLLKLFKGDLNKAISAYHAGEGNVKNGTNIGPINRQYVKNINGYMGGSSGQSFTADYSYDDYIKETEQYLLEREKLELEQASKRKEVELGVASEVVRIRSKLADDIQLINDAEFSPEKSAQMKAEYQKRADIDIQIAEAAHSDKLSGYSDYMKSEEQLLNESYARRQRDLKLDLNNSSDEYTAASLALEDQRKREVETIRRDQELDILQTKRDWMDKGKWAEEYYALIREEILSTQSYSPEMKDAKIKEVNFNQGMEQNAEREGVWSDYKSMMGLDDSPYKQDMDLLAEARAQMLITEEEYQQQRLAMQLSYGSQYGADFAGMMMGLVDSSSSAYAILGSIQKGAALFSTAMNSYTAISAAWASAPFPYNLPAVGMATMETGLLQAAVSALSPTGFADGGYTGDGGKYTIGGIVHKGEGVLTQEEIAALGGPSGFYALRQSIKSGFSDGGLVSGSTPEFIVETPKLSGIASQGPQVSVVVENYTSGQVQTKVDEEGRIRVIIRDEVDKYLPGQMNNSNSKIHKAVVRNTTATTKR